MANVASANDPQSRTTSSSTVGGDGSFQVRGVHPGKVTLAVVAMMNPSFRGMTTQVERGGVDITQNLELTESISDLRIIVTLGSGIIRGTVRFVGGEAPSNARIGIFAKRDGSNAGNGALADARGRFVISNLAGGTYEVTLSVSSGTSPPVRR